VLPISVARSEPIERQGEQKKKTREKSSSLAPKKKSDDKQSFVFF